MNSKPSTLNTKPKNPKLKTRSQNLDPPNTEPHTLHTNPKLPNQVIHFNALKTLNPNPKPRVVTLLTLTPLNTLNPKPYTLYHNP